jgi:hypothetical protein
MGTQRGQASVCRWSRDFDMTTGLVVGATATEFRALF